MGSQNHFKYTGNVQVDSDSPLAQIGSWSSYKSGQFPSDAEVNDVQFMTPALVAYAVDEQEEKETIVFVDLLRKKVYNALGEVEPEFANKIFECLSVATTMPEDTFQADEETHRKINEMQQRHDELHGAHSEGESSE